MEASYHNHTFRCMHADGTEREYIEEAIKGGFKIYGFSDHTPYPFPPSHDSCFRMKVSQIDDYCKTLEDLKKEYKNDIEIHIGLEAEYYPKHFQALLDLISDYPIEYLLLGQHCLNNEYDGPGSGWETTNDSDLILYVDQCIEALNTGKFLYFAHPDLINYVGNIETYKYHMKRLIDEANKLKIPMEINLLGIEENRNYPNSTFWELVSGTDAQIIFGADAHRPENVYRPDAIEKGLKMIEKYNLNLIDKLTLD